MQRDDAELERAAGLAGRIIRDEPRRLFRLLLEEINRFPGPVTVESTPFEARCGGGGFNVTITPYRELFLVSVGERTPCTLRVASERDYYQAVDCALQHFLESRKPA
ncbi:MAG TPA: hypothetical protein ENO08_02265 [Candidatus Eisenbacteria bacterium]|uniref:Uncharacterized protein n=1 Tax=Eiseniibacteriota bacterium TaxID=2212470 RepID=A0A7V2AU20_UNCEI|nr:hypothetical protein [Candidatus Eisenbacteria bacterium]